MTKKGNKIYCNGIENLGVTRKLNTVLNADNGKLARNQLLYGHGLKGLVIVTHRRENGTNGEMA